MNYHQQIGVTGPLVTGALSLPPATQGWETSSPTLQQTFADLAKQWNRLANELDDAYALLKALSELELKEATTCDGDLSFLEKANASQQVLRIRLP